MFYSDFSRRPINHENPSGTNPHDLDDFEKIKRQINNLNRVTGVVSWTEIEVLSRKILTYHAKDLRCACYYAVAVTHNGGLKGLIDGLAVISDICLIYWDNAFPSKEKEAKRISLFEWYVEYIEPIQRKIKVSQKDLPLVELGSYIALKIEEELRSHYGIRAPSLSTVRRNFDRWSEKIKDPTTFKKENTNQNQNEIIKINTRKEEKEENKRSYGGVLIILALLLLFFTVAYIECKEIKQEQLEEQINSSTIHDLNTLLKTINQKNNKTKSRVKDVIFVRTKNMIDDLESDPLKMNQLKKIDSILNAINVIYPDSISAKELNEHVKEKKNALKEKYKALNNDFLKVRTYFATAREKDNENIIVKTAYYYSNTLFPLLGRIEYAEIQESNESLNEAQKLLNVYQYKLNEIKDSLNKI